MLFGPPFAHDRIITMQIQQYKHCIKTGLPVRDAGKSLHGALQIAGRYPTLLTWTKTTFLVTEYFLDLCASPVVLSQTN